MFTLLILKSSDRFRRAWVVFQQRKLLYDKRWNCKYKSKDHWFIYFQNNNNGK